MNLYEEIPFIRRARGFRLYTQRNSRLLDLWRDGAIAGHRQGRCVLALKSSVEKGLMSRLPSVELHRLKKSLNALCPWGQNWRIFSGIDSARRFLQQNDINFTEVRPLLELDKENNAVFLVLLPCGGSATPTAVCTIAEDLPSGYPTADEAISPFLLAATSRAVYDWIAYLPTALAADFAWFDSALVSTGVLTLETGEEAPFYREGPWLFFRGEEEQYARVFRTALGCGVLLSPERSCPSLLPFELTEGEKRQLLKSFGI